MKRPTAFLAPILIAATQTLSGCSDAPDRPSAQVASRAEIDQGVRRLLDSWVTAFASRDLNDVRSILAADDRFVWLEDGEARYQSAEAVVAALASFPVDLAFTYRLENIQIVPVSNDMAWARMSHETEIRKGGVIVSEFSGVVSMLVERNGAQWRIVAAHTSNSSRPRPGG